MPLLCWKTFRVNIIFSIIKKFTKLSYKYHDCHIQIKTLVLNTIMLCGNYEKKANYYHDVCLTIFSFVYLISNGVNYNLIDFPSFMFDIMY